jgi:hypothetical protein
MRTLVHIALIAPLLGWGQQQPFLSARLEPEAIRIGEQAVISIAAPLALGPVAWPAVPDTLPSRIEVVADLGVDTIEAAGTAHLIRRIRITSFDTGYRAIAPWQASINGRTVESEPLLLHVMGVDLDSTAAPRDAKPLREAPFSLLWWAREHWQWFAWPLALAALAMAAMLLLRRMRKAAAPAAEAPAARPLHERVLAELEALEKLRLWQQGEHKAYQSRLTDLVRGYIEERYEVPALERTTDELLQELRVGPLDSGMRTLLENMLRAADLVKFAKALPSPQENEQLMASAIRFVRSTAPQPPADAPRS